MMNRIDKLFQNKGKKVLSIYMTAGYPELEDTEKIISSLASSGVDMIEIGMPFSDPLADGEVIQNSSQKALENGMSLSLLFKQLEGIRKKVDIPLVLMGYLNPVLTYGFENFIRKARETGIDGVILPDLPLDIYVEQYKQIVEDAGMHFIMLITPQTSDERIRLIAEHTGGFLYMVADSATTGARNEISQRQVDYFNRINDMGLEIPRIIGFGISSHATFSKANEYANGAIIGSAFINAMANGGAEPLENVVSDFVHSIIQSP